MSIDTQTTLHFILKPPKHCVNWHPNHPAFHIKTTKALCQLTPKPPKHHDWGFTPKTPEHSHSSVIFISSSFLILSSAEVPSGTIPSCPPWLPPPPCTVSWCFCNTASKTTSLAFIWGQPGLLRAFIPMPRYLWQTDLNTTGKRCWKYLHSPCT